MNSLILISMAFAYFAFFGGVLRFNIRNNKTKIIGLSIVASILIIVPVQMLITEIEIAMMIAYLYALVMMLIIYDCSIKKLFLYFIHGILTFGIVQEVIGNILEIGFNITDPLNIVLTVFLMDAIIGALYFSFIRKLPINAFLLPYKYKIRFLIIEISLTFMSTLCLHFVLKTNYKQQSIINLIITSGSLALLIVFYSALYYLNVTRNQSTQLESMNNYNEQQKSYYELLLSKEEMTRKFRHDIENDLLEILYYLDNEEVDKSTDKISKMLKDVSGIKKKSFNVGIDLFDVILNYYLVPVQDEIKIKINSNVIENAKLPVSNTDISLIMANLIKNAIEATMYLPKESRQLTVTIVVGRSSMCIKTDNTFDTSRKSLISEGTSKEDKKNHGFGIKKIEEIVNMNHGSYSKVENDNHYISEIIFTI